MVQGRQHSSRIPTASAGRESQRPWPRLRARYASHPSKNGSTAASVPLVISVKPHNKPYAHQSPARFDSSSARVAHKIVAASSAEREVSHIHWYGMMNPFGKSAQSHAAPAATPIPAMRLPARKIGTHASDEKIIFSETAPTNAGN